MSISIKINFFSTETVMYRAQICNIASNWNSFQNSRFIYSNNSFLIFLKSIGVEKYRSKVADYTIKWKVKFLFDYFSNVSTNWKSMWSNFSKWHKWHDLMSETFKLMSLLDQYRAITVRRIVEICRILCQQTTVDDWSFVIYHLPQEYHIIT